MTTPNSAVQLQAASPATVVSEPVPSLWSRNLAITMLVLFIITAIVAGIDAAKVSNLPAWFHAIGTIGTNHSGLLFTALVLPFGIGVFSLRKYLVSFRKQEPFPGIVRLVLSHLLIEPWQSMKAGFRMLKNSTDFHYYDLNPTSITKKQAEKQPTLLLHGNYHNQTAWLSFAEAIKQDGNLGPVYTVDLPNGEITDKDDEVIKDKIKQIKEQYQANGVSNPKINLVGHSRGAAVALLRAWKEKNDNGEVISNDIGKVISLGGWILNVEEAVQFMHHDSQFDDRSYEIVGTEDLLITGESLRPDDHQAKINVGHVGLLTSSEAHQCMIKWLKA